MIFEIINIIVLSLAIGFAISKLSGRLNLNKKTELPQEETIYNQNTWYYKMPDYVVKHLEECFDGDTRRVRLMRRAIELSIEHYVYEMADDVECVRIINERYPEGKDVEFVPLEEMVEKLYTKRGIG